MPKDVEGGAPKGVMTDHEDARRGDTWRHDMMQRNNALDQEHKFAGTSDRTGKWYSSAFHNTTAIVGAGVLGLPYAMKFLTWPGGVIMMCLAWATSLYTLYQLVYMHELDGYRFNRYHELGQYAFGPKLGLWVVIPFQLIVMIGLGIVYTVTGGRSLQRVWGFYKPDGVSFGLSAWIMVFVACQFILSQIPNFDKLAIISFMAAVMSLGYSTIAIGISIKNGGSSDPTISGPYNLDGFSTADIAFGAMNALGTLAFAYGGHNVVLEIQATMQSPPATAKPYMMGVYVAYAITSWCYFGVAFAGYWAFGNQVQDNVLFSLTEPAAIISLASIMVFVHVLGSYQVYSMPIFDMLENILARKGYSVGFVSRLITRSLYVAFTGFVGITIPFFGSLLGFIGAFGFGPSTFTIPPLMWIILMRPKRFSFHWFSSWFCIVYGALVTILGSIGGMRDIIDSASGYKFYS